MQIRLILAALRKHRLATALIAMEIALACAVLCNACFMIAQRLQLTRVVSGVDENALAVLQVSGFDAATANDLNARMLAGLRAIPGVQSATAVSSVPFGTQSVNAGVKLDRAGKRSGGVLGGAEPVPPVPRAQRAGRDAQPPRDGSDGEQGFRTVLTVHGSDCASQC